MAMYGIHGEGESQKEIPRPTMLPTKAVVASGKHPELDADVPWYACFTRNFMITAESTLPSNTSKSTWPVWRTLAPYVAEAIKVTDVDAETAAGSYAFIWAKHRDALLDPELFDDEGHLKTSTMSERVLSEMQFTFRPLTDDEVEAIFSTKFEEACKAAVEDTTVSAEIRHACQRTMSMKDKQISIMNATTANRVTNEQGETLPNKLMVDVGEFEVPVLVYQKGDSGVKTDEPVTKQRLSAKKKRGTVKGIFPQTSAAKAELKGATTFLNKVNSQPPFKMPEEKKQKKSDGGEKQKTVVKRKPADSSLTKTKGAAKRKIADTAGASDDNVEHKKPKTLPKGSNGTSKGDSLKEPLPEALLSKVYEKSLPSDDDAAFKLDLSPEVPNSEDAEVLVGLNEHVRDLRKTGGKPPLTIQTLEHGWPKDASGKPCFDAKKQKILLDAIGKGPFIEKVVNAVTLNHVGNTTSQVRSIWFRFYATLTIIGF